MTVAHASSIIGVFAFSSALAWLWFLWRRGALGRGEIPMCRAPASWILAILVGSLMGLEFGGGWWFAAVMLTGTLFTLGRYPIRATNPPLGRWPILGLGVYLSFASGTAVSLVSLATGPIMDWLQVPVPPNPLRDILLQAANWRTLVAVALLVCIVAPLTEELFFRRLLIGCLRVSVGAAAAIFISAVLFAAFHMKLRGFDALLLLGVIYGIVYQMTGTVWVNVVAHSFGNSFILGAILSGRTEWPKMW